MTKRNKNMRKNRLLSLFGWWVLLLPLLLLSCKDDSSTTGDNPGGGGTTDTTKVVTWDGVKRGNLSYQLLVYSFADSNGDGVGDFNGITQKLDYIDSLGCSAIWLSPIHPAMSYHGYDITDYFSVNSSYGTMADFENLVTQAHKHNIKIYLDFVLNHCGKDHPWFQAACASTTASTRDWFIFSQNPAADIAAGKIAMIDKEGANGYDSGQWFTVPGSDSGTTRLKFVLDWSNASSPKITVTTTEEAVSGDNSDTSVSRFLYFGDGVCKRFYQTGSNLYSLVVDYSSTWGFLIRTSNTSWDNKSKWGASSTTSRVTYGVPFTLFTSSNAGDIKDILFSGTELWYYHSHFWTSWFADFNYGSASTCETSGPFLELTRAAEMWIDKGVDGFRLDAVKHIYHSETSDENPTFLNKFYTTLNSYFHKTHTSDIYMVGEVFSEASAVAPYYKGLPALFEFSFWWRVKDAINNGVANTLAEQLISYEKSYATYRSDYKAIPKLSNHDENRALTDLGGTQAKAKLAAAMLLTSRGEPYIYYGEELGYSGNKSSGDDKVRQPMLWGDGTAACTTPTTASQVSGCNVAAEEASASSVLTVYRKFARARNIYPALASGTMTKHSQYNSSNSTATSVAAWYMTKDAQKVAVFHNTASSSVSLYVTDNIASLIVSQGACSYSASGSYIKIDLGAYSSAVFLLK